LGIVFDAYLLARKAYIEFPREASRPDFAALRPGLPELPFGLRIPALHCWRRIFRA
jgi:hypothetical protein